MTNSTSKKITNNQVKETTLKFIKSFARLYNPLVNNKEEAKRIAFKIAYHHQEAFN